MASLIPPAGPAGAAGGQSADLVQPGDRGAVARERKSSRASSHAVPAGRGCAAAPGRPGSRRASRAAGPPRPRCRRWRWSARATARGSGRSRSARRRRPGSAPRSPRTAASTRRAGAGQGATATGRARSRCTRRASAVHRRLGRPLQGHLGPEHARDRPLDVRAYRSRRRVDEDHAACVHCRPPTSTRIVFPYVLASRWTADCSVTGSCPAVGCGAQSALRGRRTNPSRRPACRCGVVVGRQRGVRIDHGV